jgi:hypothetical protein
VTSSKVVGSVEQLVDFLFDGAVGDELAHEMAGWLADSSRFRSFITTYRDKVRKKLRGAGEPESRLDVRAELRVACLLAADRHIQLTFEASGQAAGGPDFTLRHRGATLNLEVTRLRRPPEPLSIGRTLLAKLRQVPPSVPNALLLATEAHSSDPAAVEAAVRDLRARADAKEDAFFTRHGLMGGRGFYERFLRLSAVVVWAEQAPAIDRARLWVNPSARIDPPRRALGALESCLRAEAG